MGTRDELLEAVAARYRAATRTEKGRILSEFAEISGYHRKHAERLLRRDQVVDRSRPRTARRVYDQAVREALVVLWEAADRICGKRLKPLIPLLIPAMERHGHLVLDEEVRVRLLEISAATIDRVLATVRAGSSGSRRRRNAHSSAVRRSVPVQTYADWDDPAPGYVEADLVAHSGPSASGSFVQTLTLTDVATGWTECAPVLFREQRLLREVLTAHETAPGPDVGDDDASLTEAIRKDLTTFDHGCCTCPMGADDDPSAVTDRGGHVRGVDGLRVVDASIFPDTVSVPINLTVLMVAERIAADMRATARTGAAWNSHKNWRKNYRTDEHMLFVAGITGKWVARSPE